MASLNGKITPIDGQDDNFSLAKLLSLFSSSLLPCSPGSRIPSLQTSRFPFSSKSLLFFGVNWKTGLRFWGQRDKIEHSSWWGPCGIFWWGGDPMWGIWEERWWNCDGHLLDIYTDNLNHYLKVITRMIEEWERYFEKHISLLSKNHKLDDQYRNPMSLG